MKKYLLLLCMAFCIFFLIQCDENGDNNDDDNNDDDDNATVVAICTSSSEQQFPQIIADGSGGAIIIWEDERNDVADVYAQRIDVNRNVLWTANGVAICTALFEQDYAQLASDGSGGAYIVWTDERDDLGDIYAQHINSAGAVLWAANGLPVCKTIDEQQIPQIVSDGAGGAIIAWEDERSDSGDAYAQRVDAAGNMLWGENGTPVCTASGQQDYMQIVSDGVGGAIIFWRDGWGFIYAQRVNANGAKQWTGRGVPICTVYGNKTNLHAIQDGLGGAIITWDDYRTYTHNEIYAQSINAAGVVQWTPNGVAICTNAGTTAAHNPRIASDGAGGGIIVWSKDLIDGDTDTGDLYIQRISAAGFVMWTDNGIALCTQAGKQEIPQIISDTQGGVIIVWQDARSSSTVIYAQRVNANGASLWNAAGVEVSDQLNLQWDPQLAPDGAGGAIITWEYNENIYARKLSSNGT